MTTCSECGLSFELRLVLNERLRNPTEFFEAATRHSPRFLRKTIWRSLRPWFFWRWVVLEHRPRIGRMILGVIAGILTVEAVCTLAAGILIMLPLCWDVFLFGKPHSSYATHAYERATDSAMSYLLPWARGWQYGEWWGGGASFVALALMIQCVMPFTFVLLPQTLRRARVLPGHLVRIGAWSFVAGPIILAVYPLLQLSIQVIDWIKGVIGVKPVYGNDLDSISETLAHTYPWIELALFSGWAMLWYGFAAGRYLKLSTPWLVAASMLMISLLASLLFCLLFPGIRYDIAIHL